MLGIENPMMVIGQDGDNENLVPSISLDAEQARELGVRLIEHAYHVEFGADPEDTCCDDDCEDE